MSRVPARRRAAATAAIVSSGERIPEAGRGAAGCTGTVSEAVAVRGVRGRGEVPVTAARGRAPVQVIRRTWQVQPEAPVTCRPDTASRGGRLKVTAMP